MASTSVHRFSTSDPLPRSLHSRVASFAFSQDVFNTDSNLSSSPLSTTPPRPQQRRSKTPFHFKSPTTVLFASPPSSVSFSQTAWEGTPTKGKGNQKHVALPPDTPVRIPGLGYFAFPEGSPPPFIASSSNVRKDVQYDASGSKLSTSPRQPLPTPQKPTTTRPQTSPRARELEQAEAERGEEAWVASGGVLRDRFGHFDPVRTKKVRDEVERRERERVLRERWEAYEDGWARLIGRCRGENGAGKGKAKQEVQDREEDVVKNDTNFSDIPWPIWIESEATESTKLSMSMSINHRANHLHSTSTSFTKNRIITLSDLTLDRIEDFLLSPLSIRGCEETPKSRVRRSYLRWHPDKLGWLFERVKDEDVEDVKAGVGTVLECLRRLNGRLRHGKGGPELQGCQAKGAGAAGTEGTSANPSTSSSSSSSGSPAPTE